MCLETMRKPSREKEVFGYKVFAVNRDGHLVGRHFGKRHLKVGRIYTASRGMIKADDYLKNTTFRYRKGFHVWTSKRAAAHNASYGNRVLGVHGKYVVKRVKVWGLTAVGTQSHDNVVVGKFMKILG